MTPPCGGGKLVGATVRIAALFHAATIVSAALGNPAEIPVSAEHMEAAVKLGEFFGQHAEAAYQLMGADDSLDKAKYVLKRLERAGKSEITKRDLFSKCQTKQIKKMADLEPAVQILIERGYVREDERKTAGRSSTVLTVNPIILSA